MLRFPSTNRNKRLLFSCDKVTKKLGSLFSPFLMLLSVHLGNYPARSTWIHAVQETKANWWNITLHRLQLLYGFVDCFNFTTTAAVEKHTSQNLCYFRHCCWDSEAILSKNVSSRSPGLNYGKIFITNTEISVAKSEISATVAARLLV